MLLSLVMGHFLGFACANKCCLLPIPVSAFPCCFTTREKERKKLRERERERDKGRTERRKGGREKEREGGRFKPT